MPFKLFFLQRRILYYWVPDFVNVHLFPECSHYSVFCCFPSYSNRSHRGIQVLHRLCQRAGLSVGGARPSGLLRGISPLLPESRFYISVSIDGLICDCCWNITCAVTRSHSALFSMGTRHWGHRRINLPVLDIPQPPPDAHTPANDWTKMPGCSPGGVDCPLPQPWIPLALQCIQPVFPGPNPCSYTCSIPGPLVQSATSPSKAPFPGCSSPSNFSLEAPKWPCFKQVEWPT